MILLDTVVEVGTLPYPDRLQLASRLILEPVCGVTGQDGLAIGLTTIDYDPLGSAVSPESLSQKPFGGGQVTFFAEPELDRIAVAVNGAVQISPLTTYLDIRLIHMPFPPDGPFALIETLEKLGGVTDHPAADSGVVNGDAALCHHFLQIPQAQAISKIPPYAQQDHRSIKLPALEHLCHSLSPAQAIARDRKERVATDPIFLCASVAVWFCGVRLTVYADRISSLTGLGQVFAGMLLLGCITSLPEVANAVTASHIGNPALAVNNLLGSAAINVFFLAIGDAIVRRDALTSVVASPATLMMSVLCMLVLIAVAIAITTGDVLLIGVGAWGVILAGISVASFWLSAGYGERSPWRVAERSAPPYREAELDEGHKSLRKVLWKAALVGAVIFIAGYTLSQTGDALAQQTGLGTGMVGFVLIGIATSTPELSTIVQSIRLHRYEMAFGQVLGTNFVNLSLIVVADAVFAGGPVINELGRFEALSSLLGAALIGLFMVGLLERRNATVLRMGYDSFAVIIVFIGGLAALALTK